MALTKADLIPKHIVVVLQNIAEVFLSIYINQKGSHQKQSRRGLAKLSAEEAVLTLEM